MASNYKTENIFPIKIPIGVTEKDVVVHNISGGGEIYGRVKSLWSTNEKKKEQKKTNCHVECVVLYKANSFCDEKSIKLNEFYETSENIILKCDKIDRVLKCIRVRPENTPKILKRDRLLAEFEHLRQYDLLQGTCFIRYFLSRDNNLLMSVPENLKNNISLKNISIDIDGTFVSCFLVPICTDVEDSDWIHFLDKVTINSRFWDHIKHYIFDVGVDPNCRSGRRSGKNKCLQLWEAFVHFTVDNYDLIFNDAAKAVSGFNCILSPILQDRFRQDFDIEYFFTVISNIFKLKSMKASSSLVIDYMINIRDSLIAKFTVKKEKPEIKNFIIPDGLSVNSNGSLIDPETGEKVVVVDETDDEEDEDDDGTATLCSVDSLSKKRNFHEMMDDETESYIPSEEEEDCSILSDISVNKKPRLSSVVIKQEILPDIPECIVDPNLTNNELFPEPIIAPDTGNFKNEDEAVDFLSDVLSDIDYDKIFQ